MSKPTEQTSHGSTLTEAVQSSDGPVFVDKGDALESRETSPGSGVHTFEKPRFETLDDEISALGETFPKVAELLRTAEKYLV